MYKSLFFFVQLFVLLSIQSINLYSQKSDLQIIFSIEKTEYLEGEPVIINYTLLNTRHTRVTLYYNCNILSDIFEQLNLINKEGKKFRYCGLFADCIGGKLILPPGDSINTDENGINGYAIDLLSGYGYYNLDIFSHFPHLPEGEYTLNFNSRINGKVLVSSNIIFFKIKKPGVKDGYDKFKVIDSMANNFAKYDSLNKFVIDYPQSCYLSKVYEDYLFLAKFNKIYPEKIFNVFQNYYKKNPDSWTIGKYLRYCADTINKTKGEDAMINYLTEIMNKYPGLKLSIAAYNLLSKVIPNEIYLKGLRN